MMGKIADFSHHNSIDFSKAKNELDLAIIRVQYGSSMIDTKYKQFVAGCKQYGIPYGHYAYCRFVSVADAIVEADDFDNRADKDAKFLVADVEEQTCRNADDLVPATQAFIDRLKSKGWKVGLYTGHAFYKQYGMDKVKADFLWIPRYPSNDTGQPTGSKPDMDCDIWQYTESGTMTGVTGDVDLNVLIGDKYLGWFLGADKEDENTPYKVIIPNTAHWQAKALVQEFEQRSFKCEGVSLKTYAPNEQAQDNDPCQFVIYTDLKTARNLVIELKNRNYSLTYGEKQ